MRVIEGQEDSKRAIDEEALFWFGQKNSSLAIMYDGTFRAVPYCMLFTFRFLHLKPRMGLASPRAMPLLIMVS